MSYNKYYKPRKSQRAKESDFDVTLPVSVPKSTRTLLDLISKETGFHLKKLIAIAIDNELDAIKPFNYPAELPETEYNEDGYINEAVKIFDFIKKYPEGVDKEFLLLHRRDIGIENKNIFLHGLRELFERGQVETDFYKFSTMKNYPKDYMRIRIKK